MPFPKKSHFPVKLIVTLGEVSSEVTFFTGVGYMFSVKWLFYYEIVKQTPSQYISLPQLGQI